MNHNVGKIYIIFKCFFFFLKYNKRSINAWKKIDKIKISSLTHIDKYIYAILAPVHEYIVVLLSTFWIKYYSGSHFSTILNKRCPKKKITLVQYSIVLENTCKWYTCWNDFIIIDVKNKSLSTNLKWITYQSDRCSSFITKLDIRGM